MSEKAPIKLSPRESEIMAIIYGKNPISAAEIRETLIEKISVSSVRTFLKILETKKQIARFKESREFFYEPLIDKKTAANSALSKVLDTFFEGSLSDAVALRLDGGKKAKDRRLELERLQKLVDEALEKENNNQ